MKVQARFWVKEITHHHTPLPEGLYAVVKLAAAYNSGKGNESWSKATPSGDIVMAITNPAAAAAFELGKQYTVEFTPVES